MLKISFPHPANRYEASAYALWGGEGAVLLHERDDARFAMLLEAGGDTLEGVPDHDPIAIAGTLAGRLAVPAPPELPRLSEDAAGWEEQVRKISARFGQPLTAHCVQAAIATIRELGLRQPETLVHGDLHYGNVLSAERQPWLVVDPKGFVGDPAYDGLYVLARGARTLLAADNVERELLLRLSIFADAAGLERQRVVRWAQARAVLVALRTRDRGGSGWRTQLADRVAELLARAGD